MKKSFFGSEQSWRILIVVNCGIAVGCGNIAIFGSDLVVRLVNAFLAGFGLSQVLDSVQAIRVTRHYAAMGDLLHEVIKMNEELMAARVNMVPPYDGAPPTAPDRMH